MTNPFVTVLCLLPEQLTVNCQFATLGSSQKSVSCENCVFLVQS